MKIFLTLMSLHFFADFVCQNDWMALNKSKDWRALSVHAVAYSAAFFVFGFWFGVITLLTHFGTDALTSRATAKLWLLPSKHWFFVMIGFDQLIHCWTLVLTYGFFHRT